MASAKYPMLSDVEVNTMREDEFTEKQIQKANDRKKEKLDEKVNRFSLQRYEKPESAVKELRLLLLGKTGAGKSATGNFIIDHNEFKESSESASCTVKHAVGEVEVDDVKITLFDTPGLCDTDRSDDEIIMELGKIFNKFKDGIHGFLLVFNLGNPRYTEEERTAFNDAINAFGGEDLLQHCFLILTHGDSLVRRDSQRPTPMSLQEKLKMEENNPFGKFINDDLQKRVIAIENHTDHHYFRSELRRQIIRLVSNNAGDPYMNDAIKQYQDDVEETVADLEPEDKKYAENIEQVVATAVSAMPFDEIRNLDEKDGSWQKQIKATLLNEGVKNVSEDAIEKVTRAQKRRLTSDKFLCKMKKFGLKLLKTFGMRN